MEAQRILQVVTIMNRGGLETMLMNYYRKLDHSKIQFDFMTHRYHRGDYDDEIERLGGRIYRMPRIIPGNYYKYFRQLEEFFELHTEYKVVHAHINENSGFVLRTARKKGIPCRIAHSHLAALNLDYKLPFRWYGRFHLKKNSNCYFACSMDAGRWLFGLSSLRNGEVTVLNNAVDIEQFRYNENVRNKMRAALDINNELVIGHVGRFNEQKNHHFLIDIFYHLQKIKKDSILLLIGEGYLMNEIKEKVKMLGLENNIKFLGMREDISDLMQAMDLFLFPSLFEGLPVVLVEAQAAGLPCITSTGVTMEANLCEKVQFINLNDSPKDWAVKILSSSLERQNNYEKLSKKGYDVGKNVQQLMNLYLPHYAL